MEFVQQVAYHATTLFLFTKSDIKTTLIPITVFAVVAAPIASLETLPHVVFWIWLHLLQFDVSNQTLSPEEDLHNKSYRPLPSKRVTLRQALLLRWILVPACWAYSALYSIQVLYASIALVALTVIYNELHAHAAHWAIRNIVNALGFAAFERGSTLVASVNHSSLDNAGILSIFLSAGIFATTIQAQDFKDVEGDRLVGRQTLPILFPGYSRYTVLAGLMAWTVTLSQIWQLDSLTALGFMALALYVGVRFLAYKGIYNDQVSFYFYNVWLSVAHVLPGYWRFIVVP